MPKITLSLNTDANGSFRHAQAFNPPGPFNLTVDVFATLMSPADTTVTGQLDIDAADGSPSNQERPFRAATGQRVALGTWKLDGGDNKLVVTGRTDPARSNEALTIEVEATL